MILYPFADPRSKRGKENSREKKLSQNFPGIA